MKTSATEYAMRLGIDHRPLSDDEFERLLLVEALQPDLPRADKTKFVLTGQPPEHLREEFAMPTNPEKARLFHEARTRRLCRELGLENARLLPPHEDIIRELSTLLERNTCGRPLRSAEGDVLTKCRELVAMLPRTVQAIAWLNLTSDGRPAYASRF
jgi:hypothetical protein